MTYLLLISPKGINCFILNKEGAIDSTKVYFKYYSKFTYNPTSKFIPYSHYFRDLKSENEIKILKMEECYQKLIESEDIEIQKMGITLLLKEKHNYDITQDS